MHQIGGTRCHGDETAVTGGCVDEGSGGPSSFSHPSLSEPRRSWLRMTSPPQTSPTCGTREFTDRSTASAHTSAPPCSVITHTQEQAHTHIDFIGNQYASFNRHHLSIFLPEPALSFSLSHFHVDPLNHLPRLVLTRARLLA